LKAQIEKKFPDVAVSLIEGGRGIFDIKADGKLIYSKYQTGQFPDHDEILQML
jgi:selT/selW/selH-like putative selenoprotein